MKKFSALLCLPVFLFFSCNSADSQVPQIASDMCNCFSSIDKKLSPETKELIKQASNSNNYAESIQEQMAEMSDKKRQKIVSELQVFQEMNNPASPVAKCVKSIESKYQKAYTSDKDELMKNIVKELEKKPGCAVTASLMKVGIQSSSAQK